MLRLFQSDEQIVDSIQKGDDTALSYLYEKNIRMVIKYIVQNNGNESDAVNILQDALVLLWEKIQKREFSLKSKISTYLYAVVRNKWLQELAFRKKHTDLGQIPENPGHLITSEESVEERELIAIVNTCMQKLNSLCRKILTAFYYEEKSMQEISQMLGLANEDVAKSKKYQCKKELERLVKNEID